MNQKSSTPSKSPAHVPSKPRKLTSERTNDKENLDDSSEDLEISFKNNSSIPNSCSVTYTDDNGNTLKSNDTRIIAEITRITINGRSNIYFEIANVLQCVLFATNMYLIKRTIEYTKC